MIWNQQSAGKRRHVGRFGVRSGLVLAAFFVGELFDLVESGCPDVVADGRIFGRRASDIEFADVVHTGVALAVNKRRQKTAGAEQQKQGGGKSEFYSGQFKKLHYFILIISTYIR